MAETRKFEPGSPEGLQKLVREALGETTRPFTPGVDRSREEVPGEAGADAKDTPEGDTATLGEAPVTDDALDAAQVPDHFLYRPGGGDQGAGGGSW